MQKIENINNILKQKLSIDICDYASKNNEIDAKIKQKFDSYYTYNGSMQEAIKKIYGEDAQIIIKEKVEYEVPSSIEKIDLTKENKNRILTLSDLGYKGIKVDYYVKQGKSSKLIYLGTNKDIIIKYNEVLTISEFMDKLKQIFNQDVKYTTYTELKELRSLVGMSMMPAEYNPYEPLVPVTYEAIGTSRGNIIAKNISCKHFEGYSIDKFKADKLQLGLKEGVLITDLENIPYQVKKRLINVINAEIEHTLECNYEGVINNIIKGLNEYFDENLPNFKKNLLFWLSDIYISYNEIVKKCLKLNIKVPVINACELGKFKNSIIRIQKAKSLKYNEDECKLENKLEELEDKIYNIQSELDEILQYLNNYMENNCYSGNIYGIEEYKMEQNEQEGEERYIIYVYYYLKKLISEIEKFFAQDNKLTYEKLEEIQDYIEDVRKQIEFGRNFEIIRDGEGCIFEQSHEFFSCAEFLVNYIEKNIKENSNLIDKKFEINKLYSEVEKELDLVNQKYPKEISVLEDIENHLNNIRNTFKKISNDSKMISNIFECLEVLNDVDYIEKDSSNNLKKICFYIELFNSIVNGEIFSDENNKYNEHIKLLNDESKKYGTRDPLVLIKKGLKKQNKK